MNYKMRWIAGKVARLPFRVAELMEDIRYGKLARYDITNEYQRIYLYHIQKTGGTSLNHMFLSLGGEDPSEVYRRLYEVRGRFLKKIRARTISSDKIYVGWDKRLIERGHYFYAFSHIPKHQLNLPKKTFTITCLRDPKRRILSLYKELLEYKTFGVQHPVRTYSDRWLGNSFSDFLRNIPRNELLQQLYMFSPNFDTGEAIEGILSCSFFFRTEQFALGCAELSKILNITLQPMHMRKTSIKVDISESELTRLDSELEPEYRLLERLEPYLPREQ